MFAGIEYNIAPVTHTGLRSDKDVPKQPGKKKPRVPLSSLPVGEHVIRLPGKELEAVPPEILSRLHLRVLVLSNNKLASLPAGIGRLKRLSRLHLSNNLLVEVPESLGQLTHLEELFLDGNKLRKLPAELGRLIRLNFIQLDRNPLDKELAQVWADASGNEKSAGDAASQQERTQIVLNYLRGLLDPDARSEVDTLIKRTMVRDATEAMLSAATSADLPRLLTVVAAAESMGVPEEDLGKGKLALSAARALHDACEAQDLARLDAAMAKWRESQEVVEGHALADGVGSGPLWERAVALKKQLQVKENFREWDRRKRENGPLSPNGPGGRVRSQSAVAGGARGSPRRGVGNDGGYSARGGGSAGGMGVMSRVEKEERQRLADSSWQQWLMEKARLERQKKRDIAQTMQAIAARRHTSAEQGQREARALAAMEQNWKGFAQGMYTQGLAQEVKRRFEAEVARAEEVRHRNKASYAERPNYFGQGSQEGSPHSSREEGREGHSPDVSHHHNYHDPQHHHSRSNSHSHSPHNRHGSMSSDNAHRRSSAGDELAQHLDHSLAIQGEHG